MIKLRHIGRIRLKRSRELYRRYKLEDYWNRDEARNDGRVDVNVGRDCVKVNVNGEKK